MAAKKVAVVTGSNKGLGFAIVRGLCKRWDGDVVLTSRDVGRGEAAVAELEKEGLNPVFHQLDINDHSSIEKLRDFLKEKYGGLDILVNNAGIAFKSDATEPFGEQADVSIKTNFYATLDACKVLFQILRPHARVVNVASMVSKMALDSSAPTMKERILAIKGFADLKSLLEDFIKAAKDGDHKAKGWPDSAYGMSKLGVSVMTFIQQKHLDEVGKEDVVVNACCPGIVKTDMAGAMGQKTPDEGAETPLYLALLEPNVKEPRGCLVSGKEIVDWEKSMQGQNYFK